VRENKEIKGPNLDGLEDCSVRKGETCGDRRKQRTNPGKTCKGENVPGKHWGKPGRGNRINMSMVGFVRGGAGLAKLLKKSLKRRGRDRAVGGVNSKQR